jgi:hypothetical protein
MRFSLRGQTYREKGWKKDECKEPFLRRKPEGMGSPLPIKAAPKVNPAGAGSAGMTENGTGIFIETLPRTHAFMRKNLFGNARVTKRRMRVNSKMFSLDKF